ncbi:MAG TPA: hypothetical protein VHY09_07910 [Candidatus Methylacidiphilales bacterium]|jgi:uncharacterized protein (TIGR02598 family)|nr:hypothetical protein [Candidatus Methylacidiphilales bacterium]
MAVKPILGFGRHLRGSCAFSLVEVVLAMGIIAFALIVLFALLPVGLKSNTDSIGESQAVNLLQAMIADRQSGAYSNTSPVYNLPALTDVTGTLTGTLYLMEDGVTTNSSPANARYQVNYTIYPSANLYAMATNYPASSVPMPVSMDVSVSWPAAATNRASSVETVATFMTQ